MSEVTNLTLTTGTVPCEGKDCTNAAFFDRLVIDRGTEKSSSVASLCRHCNRKLNVGDISVLGVDIMAEISADELVNDDEPMEIVPGSGLIDGVKP